MDTKMKRSLQVLCALVTAMMFGGCTCCFGRSAPNRGGGVQPGTYRGGGVQARTYRGGGTEQHFSAERSGANVYVEPGQPGIVKVAVMPLKAATELIGSSVSDMVVTELSRTRRYQLVERGQMSQVLGETELAMAGLSETKAVEAAKMLGAEGVVIGTVDEYTMQANGGKTFAVVGLSIRLIDCATGKIVWSADIAKMARSALTPLAAHARAVVHELVSGLYQQLPQQARYVREGAESAKGRNVAVRDQEVQLPPPAPTGVAVSDMGLREATVTWTVPSAIARYRIERSENEGGPFASVGEAAARTGSFTDKTGLKDATTYYYRVVAIGVRGGVSSDPSPIVETMTAPPPDPPRDVSAAAPSSRCITVTWSAPRSDGIKEYRVERTVAESESWKRVGTSTTTSFRDGGRPGSDIEDSTLYRYRVSTVNVVGAVSEPSRTAEIKSAPMPAAVPGFSASGDQVRCVPLSWERGNETDITGYEIERADSPSGGFVRIAKTSSGAETRYLDGGRDPGNLADGHEYRYRMRSVNTVGAFGEWTDVLTVSTRPPPPVPENVEAEDGLPRSSRIAWAKSPDEKVTGYEIERKEGDGDAWRHAGTTSGRDATLFNDRAGASESAPTGRLKDGTEYLWRVRAVNVAGAKSEWSEPARAVTKVAPKAPAGLEATTDEVGCVRLSWDANEEKDIAEYVVEARAADSRSWKTISKGSKTCGAEDTGLGNGVARVYRVKAIDANTHESEWSSEVHGSSRPLPDPPRTLAAKMDGDRVVVSFEPPRDGMKEFKVYRKKFMGQELIATVAEPPAKIAAPPAGDKIDVFATAIDERGLESKPSERLSIIGE